MTLFITLGSGNEANDILDKAQSTRSTIRRTGFGGRLGLDGCLATSFLSIIYLDCYKLLCIFRNIVQDVSYL